MSGYTNLHIAITVNNIEQTKKFYSKIGFRVEEDIYSEEKKRHFLLLSGFGLAIEVFCFDDQPDNQIVSAELKAVGLQHFALPVKDIETKKQELIDKGIELTKDTSTSSLGVKNLNIKDPSGFTIEFFEKK